jgi:hypothetical protein
MGQGAPQAAAILPVDPPSHIRPERLLERRKPGGDYADMAKVDLKVPYSCRAEQRQCQAHHLDIPVQITLAEQFRAHLEDLARTPAALRLLPVHRTGVRQP